MDEQTSKPIKGLALQLEVVYTGNVSRKYTALSTDENGYVSFRLPVIQVKHNNQGVSEGSQLDKVKVSSIANSQEVFCDVTSQFQQSESISRGQEFYFEYILVPGISVIPFLVDVSLLLPNSFNSKLPSVEDPDPDDWKVSPESFGSKNYSIIGQDGCEDLLISNASVLTYSINQLIRDSSVPECVKPDMFDPCDPQTSTPNNTDKGSGLNAFLENSDKKNKFEILPKKLPNLVIKKGAYFHYQVSWNPINHGLGEILYSLPLAPCESVKLAIIDWARTDEASRNEEGATDENLLHSQRRDRAVDEAMKSSIDEWQRGGTVMGGYSGYGVTAAASYSTTKSNRNISANTTQQIADIIQQASTAARSFNSTVVMQASQAEREKIETRVVTNHNHCHSLTMLYYEVVRHYLLKTELNDYTDVLLIKSDLDHIKFDEVKVSGNGIIAKNNILQYYKILKNSMLDKSLQDGFAILKKDYYNKLFYYEQKINKPLEENELQYLKVVIKIGEDGFDANESTNFNNHLQIFAVTDWGRFNLLTSDKLCNCRPMVGANYGSLYDSGNVSPLSFNSKLFGGYRTNRNLNEINYSDLASGNEGVALFQKNSTNIFSCYLEERILWKDVKEMILFRGNTNGSIKIKSIEMKANDLSGNVWTLANKEFNTPIAIPPQRNNDPGYSIPIDINTIPPNSPSDLLTLEEKIKMRDLIDHLNHNKPHYLRQIALNEDPDERLKRFDNYVLPDELYDGGKARLSDVIDNRIIDISGDYFAFPVAKKDTATGIIKDRSDDFKTIEKIISLPTRGVFGEAKLGHCNVCEVIDNTRFWKWQESPCDCDAPEIAPISTGSRNQTQNLSPSEFPNPILSIKDAEGLPDPGGIKAALDAITKSEIFNDMSGKEQVAGMINKMIESATNIELEKIKQQAETERERLRQENGQTGGNSNSGTPSGSGSSGSAPSTGSNSANRDTSSGSSRSTGSSEATMVPSEAHDALMVLENQASRGNISKQTQQEVSNSIAKQLAPSKSIAPSSEIIESNDGQWNELRLNAVSIATEEYGKWHPIREGTQVRLNEGSPEIEPFLKNYIRVVRTESQVQNIYNQASTDRWPWSAAFISYVMKAAGCDNNMFRVSAGHLTYIRWAKNNRLNNNNVPFYLYEVNEIKPELGDLICFNRNEEGEPTLTQVEFTYSTLETASNPVPATHCDIVVEVNAAENKVITIGGNTGISPESVDKKELRLNVNGYITTSGNQSRIFAIIKFRY